METNVNLEVEEHELKNMTLAQIVTKNYKSARIFEKYDLDFCCKGNKLLSQACIEKKMNVSQVLAELINIDTSIEGTDSRFGSWEPDFLVDYIVNVHHRYVMDTIPVISAHSRKVVEVHSKNHPELAEIAKIFSAVYKDLKQHLIKEEEILFPYIKNLVKVKKKLIKYEAPYFGKISAPIKMMEVEHETAGDGLFEIRKLSSNYATPADACNTFAVFYKELREFEDDLHKHVHLENNILFPNSIELEDRIIKSKVVQN